MKQNGDNNTLDVPSEGLGNEVERVLTTYRMNKIPILCYQWQCMCCRLPAGLLRTTREKVHQFYLCGFDGFSICKIAKLHVLTKIVFSFEHVCIILIYWAL